MHSGRDHLVYHISKHPLMHGCVTHKEPQNICACCVLSIFKNNDTRHAPLSYNIHQQQRPTPASAHESAH